MARFKPIVLFVAESGRSSSLYTPLTIRKIISFWSPATCELNTQLEITTKSSSSSSTTSAPIVDLCEYFAIVDLFYGQTRVSRSRLVFLLRILRRVALPFQVLFWCCLCWLIIILLFYFCTIFGTTKNQGGFCANLSLEVPLFKRQPVKLCSACRRRRSLKYGRMKHVNVDIILSFMGEFWNVWQLRFI